jgi:hypothetical protein
MSENFSRCVIRAITKIGCGYHLKSERKAELTYYHAHLVDIDPVALVTLAAA